MESIGRYPDKEPPKAVSALAEQVDKDGGHVLAVYQEPVGDRWQIFVLLPRERVEPTPYQRDLSPTHSKRLTDVVKRIDRFVDPIVAVSPKPGVYWTPNGHHRLSALSKLKAKLVPAILIPEAEVAYQILALNTEKAHNLKEKSLEVIRMYRGLMEEYPKSSEEDFSFQFEAPHFITLGLLYEENRRFAGGAFAPILKRVDKFLKGKLPRDDRRAEGARGQGEGRGRGARQSGGGAQEARDQPPLRQAVRPRPHHPPQPAAEDAAVLRPDLHEASGRDQGIRPEQGALPGRAARGHLLAARRRLSRAPAWRAQPQAGSESKRSVSQLGSVIGGHAMIAGAKYGHTNLIAKLQSWSK